MKFLYPLIDTIKYCLFFFSYSDVDTISVSLVLLVVIVRPQDVLYVLSTQVVFSILQKVLMNLSQCQLINISFLL